VNAARLLAVAALALAAYAAGPAHAECVTYTPGPVIDGPDVPPIQYVVRGPGTVSVTPTDCPPVAR